MVIGRLLGAFPLHRKRTNFEISPFWLVYSLGALSIQNAYTVYKLNGIRTPNVKLYHAVLSTGHYIANTAIVYAGLAVVLRNRRQINKFYYHILQARRMLKNLKTRRTSSRNPVALCIAAFLTLIFTVKFVVRGLKPTLTVFLKEFGSMNCHLGVIGSVSVFSMFAGMIEEELEALYEILTKASRNPGKRIKIQLMSDVHYLLSTTADDLNSCFYQSYFMIICGSVWSETSSISSTIYNFWTTKDYLEGALQFMWIVFWFVIIFATVIPCSSASHLSKKCNFELSLMLVKGFHFKELMRGDKEKLQLHVDFDFTVCFNCGFFQLDRTLIHSILGNVTSFAVIFAQVAIIQGV